MTRKQAVLEKYIFKDLTNLNNGFDVEGIQYFSKTDFEILLDRVEQMGIGIYGIEPWPNGEFAGVKSYEEYGHQAKDPKWYRKAFADFLEEGIDSHFAATFHVPAEICL